MMAFKLQNAAVGLALFGILVSLLIFAQHGIRDAYELEDLDTRQVETPNGSFINVTIGDALDNLLIVRGLNRSMTAAFNIKAPEGANALGDILGSLAATAIGTVQVIASLLTTPFEIAAILHTFYSIPVALTGGLIALLAILIGFVVIKIFTGGGDI